MTVTATRTGAAPPRLAGPPVIGPVAELKRDTLGTFVRAREAHGDVVHVQAGPPLLRQSFYVAFHPDGAQRVLAARAAEYRKDNIHWREMAYMFGNGMVSAQDDEWLAQRRIVQPMFTPRRVNTYAEMMSEEVESSLPTWFGGGDGGVVDVHPVGNSLALRVAGRTLFGGDLEEADGPVREYFPVLGDYVMKRGMTPRLLRVPHGWPTPFNRRAHASRAKLYEVYDRIIKRRQETGDYVTGNDVISLLLNARAEGRTDMSDADIRDQVLLMLVAAHETSSVGLTFSLYQLGLNPEVQRRAQAQVDEVLGDRKPTIDDVKALSYISMLFKETLRLYPPVPLLSRRIQEGDEIGGYRIPPKSDVWVIPWATHRHPEFWPDPERFDPDRFTPEQESARHRTAWIPFGAGPRACIGQHFSMLEMIVVLSAILRKYDVRAIDRNVSTNLGVSLSPAGPVRCAFTPRER